MFNDNIHNFIKEQLSSIGNLKEENIKIHIVIPVLDILGYDKKFFDFEYTRDHKNKIVDMAWIYGDNILYIEVKRGDYELSEDDVKQLTDYIVSKNINWGILTNGKRYILINKNIECIGFGDEIYLDRIAFDEDLSTKKTKSKVEYLSKQFIFDNKCSEYLKDIAQFKVYYIKKNNGESWKQYKSTLNNFIEYLVKKYGRYKSFNLIYFEDYIDYWKDKISLADDVMSIETYRNQHSHISSMFKTLHENSKLINNNFAYITKEEIEESYYKLYNIENIDKEEFVLNEQNVIKAINVLKDNNRNIIILLLAVYCGITRSEIVNLKWEDIDFAKDKIKLKDRTIPLPKTIKEKLTDLYIYKKSNKIKITNLFYVYSKKKYSPITANAVYYIFDILKEEFWNNCNLEKICTSLIPLLYKNGYSIEEISYLTGKSLSILEKIIPYEIMIKGIKLNRPHKDRKHPFASILQL